MIISDHESDYFVIHAIELFLPDQCTIFRLFCWVHLYSVLVFSEKVKVQSSVQESVCGVCIQFFRWMHHPKSKSQLSLGEKKDC